MSRNQHHANLLIGTPEAAESYLRLLCTKWGVALSNNPDFFIFRPETFGIDEARELKLLSARKAISPGVGGQSGRKLFLIVPARLTLEAQNALLKTFEDPFPDTFFFLVTREEGLIVPTLRSRMQIFHLPKDPALRSGDAETFLSSSVKSRLLFVQSFVAEERNLPTFLDSLLLLLRGEHNKSRLLKKVYNVRRFAHDTAVAPRLILEHLSLVL